jgi:hypothetical protein
VSCCALDICHAAAYFPSLLQQVRLPGDIGGVSNPAAAKNDALNGDDSPEWGRQETQLEGEDGGFEGLMADIDASTSWPAALYQVVSCREAAAGSTTKVLANAVST